MHPIPAQVLSELFDDIYDIKIFQQLPLPLRMQVLKGKILYSDDLSFMYDKAYETIKEFESFKRILLWLPRNRTYRMTQGF